MLSSRKMQISLKHQIYQKPGKVYEERGTESWLGPIHNERRKQNKFLLADNTNSLAFCECFFLWFTFSNNSNINPVS
jgi:hypothetical protein